MRLSMGCVIYRHYCTGETWHFFVVVLSPSILFLVRFLSFSLFLAIFLSFFHFPFLYRYLSSIYLTPSAFSIVFLYSHLNTTIVHRRISPPLQLVYICGKLQARQPWPSFRCKCIKISLWHEDDLFVFTCTQCKHHSSILAKQTHTHTDTHECRINSYCLFRIQSTSISICRQQNLKQSSSFADVYMKYWFVWIELPRKRI